MNRIPGNTASTLGARLRTFYETSLALAVTNVVGGMIMIAIIAGSSVQVVHYIWLAAVALVVSVRYVLARRFLSTSPENLHLWQGIAVVFSTLTGLLWGACTLLFYSSADTVSAVLVTLTLLIINTIGAFGMNNVLPAYFGLLFGSMSLYCLRLLFDGSRLSLYLAAATVIMTFMLFWFSRAAGASTEENYRLREENLDLLKEARREEQRLKGILDNLPTPLTIASIATGNLLYANPAAYRMFRYDLDKDEVRGTSAASYYADPKQRESLLRQIRMHGYSRDMEFKFRRKDGTEFWGLLSAVVMEYSGEQAVLSTVTDITSRKSIEREVDRLLRFQDSIIETANDWLLVVDKELRVVVWNSAAEQLSGFTRDEIIGTDDAWELLFTDENERNRVRQKAGLILSGEQDNLTFESNIWSRDGQKKIINWKARQLVDQENKTLGVLSLGRDITERKRREAQLQQTNVSLEERTRELEELNRELDAFAHSVSHDLRTPLGQIAAYCDLIDAELDANPENSQQMIGRIRDVTRRMDQLISDLMWLSRAGKQDLERETFDLGILVLEAIGDWREREPDQPVSLDISRNVDADIDRRLMRVAIENLVSNAWKFSRYQPETSISFGEISRDGKRVFYVRDKGIGFDMDRQDDLFKPFVRLHSDPSYHGTGLGLTIIDRIIRRHGGRVWAESKPGEGAAFYFTLQENS